MCNNSQYKCTNEKTRKGKVTTNTAVSINNNFKGCNQKLVEKNGEVFSVAPKILTIRAASNKVTVSVRKTGGRAATQVNIYVNNVLRQGQRITFPNGRDTTPYRIEEITGVRGKTVKVEIVNQSVGSTFRYSAKIVGKTKSLMPRLKVATGTLVGQGFKNIVTKKSCTNKTKIVIKRTGGKARATIRIFEKTTNGNYTNLLESITFEKGQTKKEFIMNSRKKLKVELKNISVGKTIKYRINAVAIQ